MGVLIDKRYLSTKRLTTQTIPAILYKSITSDTNLNLLQILIMIPTLDFSGNIITALGFIGIVSSLVILVSVFSSYHNSPVRK